MFRPVPLVLAVIAPLVVFGGAYRLLSPADAPEIGPAARAIDARVRDSGADVVVVGASYAYADINPTILGKALSATGTPAAIVSIGAANAPVWYALLKERVYGNGLRPALVVLPVGLASALATRLPAAQAERLAEQMPVPDDVVMARSYGSRVPAHLQRLIDRRGSLRDPILDTFRTAFPRLFFGADELAVRAAGTDQFGEQHAVAGARLLPVVEEAGPLLDAADIGVTDPEESYLADIADLVQDNGGRLAIVLPPLAPNRNAGLHLAPAVEARVVEWANGRAIGWLDRRDLGWDSLHFSDDLHMKPAAAAEFTTEIASALLALGARAPEGFSASTPPLVATGVRRVGTPPALPTVTEVPRKAPCAVAVRLPEFAFLGSTATGAVAAGIHSPLRVLEGDTPLTLDGPDSGCAGSFRHPGDLLVSRTTAAGSPLRLVWSEAVPGDAGAVDAGWVYPGTSLEWTFARPWAGADAHVVAEVLAFGAGAGAARLRVGDNEDSFRQGERRLRAEAAAPTDDAPWTVAITSPGDGPFLLVRALRVEAGGRTAPIVAEPAPRVADVFDATPWTITGTPPPVGPYPIARGRKGQWFVVPPLGFSTCTPFRIRRGDEPLARDVRGPGGEAPPGGAGVYQAGDRLYLPAAITPEQLGDGAGFHVDLDPDRHCRASFAKGGLVSVWMYGGDTLRAEVPRPRRHALGGDVQRVHVQGATLEAAGPAAPLHLTVHAGDASLVETDVSGDTLRAGTWIELPRAVPAREAAPLTVTLSWPGAAPPVLVRVRIGDSGA